jgi:predicted dinucleotide-binding enzyme
LQLANEVNLAGKIVVDVTNPLGPSAAGGIELVVDQIGSGGEQVQKWLPNSWVVKTLNVLNAGFMLDAAMAGDARPLMFVAGEDHAAKEAVSKILQSAGWQVADLGGIRESRLLEALAMLWIKLAVPHQKWDFALQPVTLHHRAQEASPTS